MSGGRRSTAPTTRIRRFCLLFLAALPFFLIGAVVSARLAGYQVHVISSGSMRPTYEVGDLVIGKSVPIRALHQGDIITVRDSRIGGRLLTHRVHTIAQAPAGQIVVRTKGDANRTAETWIRSANDTVERVWLHIPVLGRFYTDPLWKGTLAVLLLGLAGLGVYNVARDRRLQHRGRRVRAEVAPAARLRFHRPGLSWVNTAWLAVCAVIVVGTVPSYSAWIATDTNSNSFSTNLFSTSFSYTTCSSTKVADLVVPAAGYNSAHVVIAGGNGGNGGGAAPAAGGSGVSVTYDMLISPNEDIGVYVGCQGTDASGLTAGIGGVGVGTGGNGGAGAGTGDAGGGGGGLTGISCVSTCYNSGPSGTYWGLAGGGGGGGGASASPKAGGAGAAGTSGTGTDTNGTGTSGTGYNGKTGTTGAQPCCSGGGAGGTGGSGNYSATYNGTVGGGPPATNNGAGGGGGAGNKFGGGGASGTAATPGAGGGGGGSGESWLITPATYGITGIATGTNNGTNNSGDGYVTINLQTIFMTCGSGFSSVTVPSGKSNAVLVINAGNGGAGGAFLFGAAAGAGTKLNATFAVTAGSQLDVYVGCQGGAAPGIIFGGAGGTSSVGYASGGAGGAGNQLDSSNKGYGGGGAGAASAVLCHTGTGCTSTGILAVAGGGGGGGGAGAGSGSGAGSPAGGGTNGTTESQAPAPNTTAPTLVPPPAPGPLVARPPARALPPATARPVLTVAARAAPAATAEAEEAGKAASPARKSPPPRTAAQEDRPVPPGTSPPTPQLSAPAPTTTPTTAATATSPSPGPKTQVWP